MRKLVRQWSLAVAFVSLVPLFPTNRVVEAASDEACPRLAGPPAYGSPAVGKLEGPPHAIFRVRHGAGEAPWLVQPRLTPDDTWELTRLVVERPDRVRAQALASFPHRPRQWDVLKVLAGDPTGDGHPDLLVYWSVHGPPYEADLLVGGADGFTVQPDVLPMSDGYMYEGTFGDFDGDGADELAWRSNAQAGRILVHDYRSGAGFTWLLAKQLITPYSLLAMHVDGDGIEDLVHVERVYDTGLIYVHYGDTDRPFGLAKTRGLRFRPISVAQRSSSAAGPAEVVVLQRYPRPGQTPLVRMVALERAGPGGWVQAWAELMPAEYNRFPEVWDLDRDGHDDFVFRLGDYYQENEGFVIARHREGAPYEPMHRSEGRARLLDVRAVDDDEIPDALMLAGGGALGRFRGVAPFRFDEGRSIWETQFNSRRYASFGDLDEDGLDDIVISVDGGKDIFWWRALGAGEYASTPIPPPPGSPGPLWVADFDADGHQDIAIRSFFAELEQYVLLVGWGDASGVPASWRPAMQGPRLTENVFVDLDGDGDLDWLGREFRGVDWRDGSDLRVFVNEGRNFRLSDSAFLPPFDKGGGPVNLVAADVDRDGLVDAIHFANDPQDRWASRVVWRPNLGEGRFGESRELLGRSLPGFPRFVPTDVDRDDDIDLVVIDPCQGEGTSVRVLGNDGESFRPFWSGPESNDCPQVELADVDGDDLLDLHEKDGSTGRFRVWTADGTGGFTPAGHTNGFFVGERSPHGGDLATVWGGEGPDHVETSRWSSFVVTLPQRTDRLDQDVAPPAVSLQLVPEVDTFGQAAEFGGAWRVTARAVDECTLTEVTWVFARIPELHPAISARFAPDDSYEVRLYESLGSGERAVVLRGPDEATARDLFAEMLGQGGFELKPNAFLDIQTYDDWGRPPRDLDDQGFVTLPEARLTHRWKLERGELNAVRVHRPGADVTFDVAAVDGTGKRAAATGTYQEQLQRYCAEHPGQRTVCD